MPSKAETFAAAAEEAGWQVKLADHAGRTVVHARRSGEQWSFAWVNGKFDKGRHKIGEYAEPWSNVKQAIGRLSAPPMNARVVDGKPVVLPFDIENASDAEVLMHCAGRHLTWVSSLDPESEQSGNTPRGGIHYKLTPPVRFANQGERILHFPDMGHTGLPNDRGGWRSVALSALRSVT